uniref:Uncharacterized protein n=1 Tax=Panagrolaimus sp. ES5 TaxID=591445 RepID=A0AC34FA30_9BILA
MSGQIDLSINNARKFFKANFEIVRNVYGNIYVIKYPTTLMHQRIFECLKVASKALKDFVTPKRNQLVQNKIYLVDEEDTGIFSRVTIVSFENEVLLRIWHIDEDKYSIVAMDRIRLADGFDSLYPLYQTYELEMKIKEIEPSEALINDPSAKKRNNVAKPMFNPHHSNTNIEHIFKNISTKSISGNETNIKPEKRVDLNLSFSSTENMPVMEDVELHTALNSTLLSTADQQGANIVQFISNMGISSDDDNQVENVSHLSSSTSFSSDFAKESSRSETEDMRNTHSSPKLNLSVISQIREADTYVLDEILAEFETKYFEDDYKKMKGKANTQYTSTSEEKADAKSMAKK